MPGVVFLVKGPIDVIINGDARILGKNISDSRIFLGDGKVWPIETRSRCDISLSPPSQKKPNIGEFWTSNRQETGTKIWEEVIYTIFHGAATHPKSILVVGPTDSGKTTLSTYIVNQAIAEGLKPAVIDADIGQGDIAPPCAIGGGIVEKQILDLRHISTKFFAFIGSMNPAGYGRLTARSVQLLLNKLTTKKVDLVVINTDGYVTGNGLLDKLAIANKVKPDVIICLGKDDLDFCVQVRARIQSRKIPRLLNAKSPLSTYPILKLRAERARRRVNQFQKYIADFGKPGKTRRFSLRKINFVYKGLVYYRAYVTTDDNLLLVRNYGTRKVACECMINMFVGLGKASNIVGFGIITSITKQEIAIHTNVAMVDTIYLSNIGISMLNWRPYINKINKRKRDTFVENQRTIQ
jgi:polynucleotide 5'-hydroxyl-kinase GRC3/NOL9